MADPFGVAGFNPREISAAATGVSGPQAGVASGFSSTALQLGSAIGLAVVVAVSTHSGHEAAQVGTGLQEGLRLVTAGASVAALTTLLLPRTARRSLLAAAVSDPEAMTRVDSGRFAEPFWYLDSPLTTPSPDRRPPPARHTLMP